MYERGGRNNIFFWFFWSRLPVAKVNVMNAANSNWQSKEREKKQYFVPENGRDREVAETGLYALGGLQ